MHCRSEHLWRIGRGGGGGGGGGVSGGKQVSTLLQGQGWDCEGMAVHGHGVAAGEGQAEPCLSRVP